MASRGRFTSVKTRPTSAGNRSDAMNKIVIALAIPALLTLGACTPHTTGATEVGVRFNKITRSTEVAQPGATYFFTPIINDWATFDVSTQNLMMSAKVAKGERREK